MRTLRSSAFDEEGNRRRPWKPGHCGVLARHLLRRARSPGPVPEGPLDPRDRLRGVARPAARLARLAGLEALHLGGSLHDVGKISVDAGLLCKPGPLTEDELEQIRRHPVTGARLVESFEDFEPALPYVLHHHERWDGFGYPHGLAGSRIPIEARLLGVADAFDAMTSARAYRPALTVEQALVELERCAGTQFDPELAQAFVDGWRQGEIAAPSRAVRVAI